MSTKTKHTPGPWEVRPTSNKKNGTRWRDIVSTGAPFSPCYIGEAIDADARLMAAAPELLEALQEIIAAADGEGWSQLDAGFTKARAAVAKALGND